MIVVECFLFFDLEKSVQDIAFSLEWLRNHEREISALNGIFLAIFTIVLAAATAFLWKATRDLVFETKSHGKRALRAYISVSGGHVRLINDNSAIEVSIQFKIRADTRL